MAKQGWVKLYRKITDSLVWSDPSLLKMWILCLTKANHDSGTFNFNGKKILLNSGQFVTGRTAISDEFNYGSQRRHQISAVSAWRLLRKLESMEMLYIKTTTKYSVVTVLRWVDYQEIEQQPDIKPTTTRQQPDTNKNDKNEENEKNITTTSLSEKNLKSVFDFWEQSGFGLLSPTTMQNFEYWVDDFTKLGATESDSFQLLKKAIQVSDQNGVKKYAYVNSILKNWREKGFKQVADVDAAEAQRNSQKSKNTRQPTEAVGKYLQGDDDDLPF